MDKLFTAQEPAVAIRAVALDLKGVPPTPKRLVSLLKVVAAARYNAVLVEWEDTFPWSDARFRCETAYTPDEVTAFHRAAGELGLAIIPLVQCLAHSETPLRYLSPALRELPHCADVFHPLAPGARELVERMVDEVLALSPGVKFFHLGGDEAWSMGQHPASAAYIARHGKGRLYLHHVEPILDKLMARGIRPILWHDMMRDWDDAALRDLGGKADLCVWNYNGGPDDHPAHCGTAFMKRFQMCGIPLWGAVAYKGAEGSDADLPDLAKRLDNTEKWAQAMRPFNARGIVATAWSRYDANRVQCEPIDAALDSMVLVGAALHDGNLPPPAREMALDLLASLGGGEKDRFVACRDLMARLAALRGRGWERVREICHQIACSTDDPRRRGAGGGIGSLKDLKAIIADIDALAREARTVFDGLIDPIWTQRYFTERVEPLREQFYLLLPRVRQLEPVAFAAETEL